MISQEELDLYQKHQGLFREKMGPKQDGDLICCEDLGGRIYRYSEELDSECDKCIILPIPIDPVNPERGLITWVKDFICLNDNGKDGWEVCVMADRGKTWNEYSYKGSTPTLALLRAIDAQEGEHEI